MSCHAAGAMPLDFAEITLQSPPEPLVKAWIDVKALPTASLPITTFDETLLRFVVRILSH